MKTNRQTSLCALAALAACGMNAVRRTEEASSYAYSIGNQDPGAGSGCISAVDGAYDGIGTEFGQVDPKQLGRKEGLGVNTDT